MKLHTHLGPDSEGVMYGRAVEETHKRYYSHFFKTGELFIDMSNSGERFTVRDSEREAQRADRVLHHSQR